MACLVLAYRREIIMSMQHRLPDQVVRADCPCAKIYLLLDCVCRLRSRVPIVYQRHRRLARLQCTMHGCWSPLQSSDAAGEERVFILKQASSFGRLSSRSASFVAMMQTADLREGNDLARGWRMYWTGLRAVLVERKVCSALVMILKIRRQHAA